MRDNVDKDLKRELLETLRGLKETAKRLASADGQKDESKRDSTPKPKR
jgi:hypothetical protein